MAEPQSASAVVRLRFLTFRVDERLYAVPAEDVLEVIRTPRVARVPQAPRALMGLANLRGAVLAVATARGLVGRPEHGVSASSRTIVLGGAATAGLAVDGVEGLVSVDADRVETRQAELAANAGEQLVGAFQLEGQTDVARVLDIRGMLAGAFAPRARPERRVALTLAGTIANDASRADGERLVTFEVAGQAYALPVDTVREIMVAPAEVTRTAGAEAVLLGVVPYREGLLPLLSLRGLLGFGDVAEPAARGKVLVTAVAGGLVGLVADQARAVILADPDRIEPAPSMLAARTGGEAKVQAIYRLAEDRGLVSILAPAKLFREDVMARLSATDGTADAAQAQADAGAATDAPRQYVVFRLGADEYGLPIDCVDEVARAPQTVARVPKAPKFLEGVINLRGEVLPVVDQRRRFDMPPAEDLEARRLIVLRTDRRRAGLIVDAVSEVLRCDARHVEPAPDLTGEANRLVEGVLNLEAAGRLIMILDPAELLTRAERGLLDAFQPAADKAGE